MAARTPSDFTRYISDSLISPRLPIIRTSLDAVIDEQQFAIDCEQLVVSAACQLTPAGVGVKVVSQFNNLLGKQTGDKTLGYWTARAIAYINVGNVADVWWFGTRTDHDATWTWSSVAPGAVGASWRDFGSNVLVPIGGDIAIAYSGAAGARDSIYCVGIYAVET